MGYYIQGPAKNKVEFIREQYGAELISKPASFAAVPAGKALVVVVDNGFFEAAAYAYNEREFEAFTDQNDRRAKFYLVMDLDKARELSGFSQ